MSVRVLKPAFPVILEHSKDLPSLGDVDACRSSSFFTSSEKTSLLFLALDPVRTKHLLNGLSA
jgi:hypothetical protein